MIDSASSTFDKVTNFKNKSLFHAIMNFETPDRVPLWSVESVTEQAVRKRCREENFPLEMKADDVQLRMIREGIAGYIFFAEMKWKYQKCYC